jgi:hypothetical protein
MSGPGLPFMPAAQPASAFDGQLPPPPLPPPPPRSREAASKRRSVTVACEPCRKRKSKCDAARPACFPCQRHDTHCVYETLGVETHSQALKRKHSELSARLDGLTELFELLRAWSEDDAQAVFQQIRSGADPKALLRRIKGSDMPMRLPAPPLAEACYEFPYRHAMPSQLEVDSNPYLYSKLYENTAKTLVGARIPATEEPTPSPSTGSERKYRIPYHACRLAEPLVERVKPSEWTRVSSNDNLLRSLLEIYFLAEFPFQPFFHKDFFLRDMASGREQYCSPLLVNAVLASACVRCLISEEYLMSRF